MPGARAWSAPEIERLSEMVESGASLNEIAAAVGRGREAVDQKRRRLGLAWPVYIPPNPLPRDIGPTVPSPGAHIPHQGIRVESELPCAPRKCENELHNCAERSVENQTASVRSSSEPHTLFALIGDTHFGSKHCAEEELVDFYGFAYQRGVRDFYHTGDLIAGYHKKWRSELCEVTLDGQIDLAIDGLPRLDGANTRFVTGNHEDKAHRAIGIGVGAYIAQRFRAAGRTDVQFVGGNRAHVQLPSGKWLGIQHPGGGGGENLATSAYGYLRQDPRWAELSYYACGHWHKFDYGHRAHCHIWAVPCFEKSSIWGQSLRGGPDVGGVIVHDDGRNFGWTVRLY